MNKMATTFLGVYASRVCLTTRDGNDNKTKTSTKTTSGSAANACQCLCDLSNEVMDFLYSWKSPWSRLRGVKGSM